MKQDTINIKNHFAKLIKAAPGVTISETLGKDKLYRYSAGAFKTRAEAAVLQKKAKELGWKDCFVTSYNREKK